VTRVLLLLCVVATGCASAPAAPIQVRLGEDACAYCRMTIVSTTTAAQIVVPGAEPVIFDELGCLSNFLSAHTVPGAAIFVADHRTGSWVDAGRAVFTRTGVQTPMSSGLLAHADAASRDADPAARNGTAVAAADVLRTEGGRR
jgi:copper chaperone NosL